ncbi:hypothetical protein EG329_006612 [Mollisiaceae sp. DMI_Dod_QoI]|nr:hypothetical protein EG329_006612 [Helotiales sp. DMI_Dod_QoI]
MDISSEHPEGHGVAAIAQQVHEIALNSEKPVSLGSATTSNEQENISKLNTPVAERLGIHALMSYYIAEDWEKYTTQADSSFCEDCQWTFHDWGQHIEDSNYNYYRYGTDIDRVKGASAAGCPFCSLLWMAISHKISGGYKSDPSVGISFERRGIGWQVFFNAGEYEEWRSAVEIIPATMLDPANLPALKLRGSSTRGVHAMNKAREWLTKCKHSHPGCGEEVERSLPARLLQFREGNLRLISTDGLDTMTKYAALSHCWGKIKILRLLKENFEAFQISIPISELSKTFRDSLQVITELGLEYIWIDSLCIIQDDSKDWEREAVKMSAVYGCSEVTIAASSSEDGSKGCFYDRQLPLPRLCQLHLTNSEATRTFNVIPFEHWDVALSRLVLSTRGWCYQERRLSPRVLFFTSTHLAWQCKSWGGEEWKTEGVDKVSSFFNVQSPPHAESYWDESIKEYAACKLTFWSDKLIAISGVAKRRQNAVGGEYVAGMWREDLERQLCWTTTSRSAKPQDQYMAPSWSWASTAHPIQAAAKYKDIRDPLVAKVLDVKISLAGSNPIGEIRRGVLKLQCRGLFHGIVAGQTPTLIRFGKYFMRRISFCDYLEVEKIPCYYLPIRRDDSGGFEGLIVKPTYQAQGEYKRIGCFVAQYHKKGGKKIQAKGDVDALSWDDLQFSEADRQLLFVISEGARGPHLVHIV